MSRSPRSAAQRGLAFGRMSLSRTRVLILTLVVAALLLYGAGHGLHQMSADEGMASALTGLCLLVATVLGYTARPKVPTNGEPRFAEVLLVMPTQPAQIAVDRRARASPSALQRFRN